MISKNINNNGSKVFIYSLDAYKAFDRTNHFALFACMFAEKYSYHIINIISCFMALASANDLLQFSSFLVVCKVFNVCCDVACLFKHCFLC